MFVGPIALRYRPAALVDQPVDEGSDGIRERVLDLPLHDGPVVAVRSRDGERHDTGLPLRLGTKALERHVARLAPVLISGHHGLEGCVHGGLQ